MWFSLIETLAAFALMVIAAAIAQRNRSFAGYVRLAEQCAAKFYNELTAITKALWGTADRTERKGLTLEKYGTKVRRISLI